MLKKIVSGLMVIMLLESVMCIATVFPNTAAAASSSGSEDWWQAFRHDPSHTGHSSSAVPTTLCPWWDTEDTINGSVRSSPAVVNNRVFVGSSNKTIYILNATTGSIIRTFYAGGAVESSPTVADDKVFFGSMNGSVYALSEAGNFIWSFPTPTKGSVYSSPAIADGVVFFGSLDGYVYALDAADGTEKWRYRTASAVYSSPAIYGDRVFVGASDGRVYALNMTGRCEWFFDAGQNCSSSPSVADGKVFVGSDDRNLHALNVTTGKHLWNYTTDGKVKSSPAIAYGCVFFGSMNGSVYALTETGDFLWRNTTGGFVYSSPAIADGKVIVGSGDNRTYVLNATDGHHLWNSTTGAPIYSSPAIAQEMVFIGSDDKKVYAFGPENQLPQPIIHHYPERPSILQKVILDGSASYDPEERGIANCTWDFGDGTPLDSFTWKDGNITTHTYESAGNYPVTLTVTDNHPIQHMRGTNMTSLTVNVTEAWPMYRHDWNHTGCTTSLAPPTKGLLWDPPKTIGVQSTDDLMYSSPAVIDDMVYIASTINSTNGKIYAIGATNGSIVWSKVIGKVHSSPAVADGLVFVGDYDGKMWAIKIVNGAEKWVNSTGYSIYSSPTVAYGLVFVASTSRLYAFDANSGNEIWPVPFDAGGSIYSSPAVCDGKVYISSWAGKVYALNAMTGIETDESNVLSNQSPRSLSSPVVSHGRVFVGTSNGTICALDAANLKSVPWSKRIGNRIDSSPAVTSNRVFVGSDNDTMYAFSLTGELKWKWQIGSVRWSSPAAAESKVFVGSTNGKIYALKEGDNTPVWSYLTGGPVDSSPAVLNGTLYVASKDGKLYAFWAPIHDVAITGVNLSAPRVDPGETVNINVTVENQGEYDEVDINVTAFYSNATHTNQANSTIISLAKRSSTTVPLLWNTMGVAEDTYTISAKVTVAIDNDTIDNDFADGTLTIGGWHDINVTDVWLGYDTIDLEHRTKTVVGQGYNATVWAMVENEGDFNETNILVTAYWSKGSEVNQTIGTVIIGELRTNEARLVSILWKTNATGILLAKGNYTVHVEAEPVPIETETADNVNQIDYEIHLSTPGDVNADKNVDLKDIFAIGKAYGSRVCELTWNPNCDIDNNGVVDFKDYYRAGKNFGKPW